MIVGHCLKYALMASALASYPSAEAASHDADNNSGLRRERMLSNKKMRGITTDGYWMTSAPIGKIESPTFFPTLTPTLSPSVSPVRSGNTWGTDGHPTLSPTVSPTFSPSLSPTNSPIVPIEPNPTLSPTFSPTVNPTKSPSKHPVWKGDSWKSDGHPTLSPTWSPTFSPTLSPVAETRNDPTKSPAWKNDGWKADGYPTLDPTLSPTLNPTQKPTPATEKLTLNPTLSPTLNPTLSPSICGQYWHRSLSDLNPNSCTNDNNRPADNSKLYTTVQECCKAEFGKVAGCQVFNVCGPRTPGPASTAASKPTY